MITDTERCEMARNMRDCIQSKTECELLSLNGSSAAIRWLISYTIFGDKEYHSGVDLMNRLADFIEPPARCPHYMHPCCQTDVGGTYIDRNALLKLADEIDMDASCHAYVDDYVANDYARRIREALGE